MSYVDYTVARLLSDTQREKLCERAQGFSHWKTILSMTGPVGEQGVRQRVWDLDSDSLWESKLYRSCEMFIHDLNRKYWGFKLTDWAQPLRINRYPVGHFHDWHMEHLESDRSKLSFSCPLNTEFVGGELQLLSPPTNVTLQPGEAAVFPSYAPHRVTKVTAGERFVLLGWMAGPRFR